MLPHLCAILTNVVLVALAALDVALFAYYVWATFIGQPYWDMFSIVQRYLQYRADGNVWSYLWEPHVQHRMVWMRLLTGLDASLLAGRGYPFAIFAVACQGLTAWLLARAVRRCIPGSPGVWLSWVTVMLVLTAVAAVDCALPINGIYPQALMFSVLALVLADGGSGDGTPWRVYAPRAGALLAAMAAAFGNAAALALWPILLWVWWRSQAGRWWLGVTTLVGAAFVGAYAQGLPGAPQVGPVSGLALVARAGAYLVSYLGLPLTRAGSVAVIGQVVGVALLVAGAAVLTVRGLVFPAAGRNERFAVSLIAFSMATAVLAAVGRVDVDVDVRVPVRYAVFMAPMHIGLLMLLWPRIAARGDRHRRGLQGVAVAMALVLLAQQVVAGQAAVATTAAIRQTLARFSAGEVTPDMTTVVYVDLAQARRDQNAIHAAGLYLRAR